MIKLNSLLVAIVASATLGTAQAATRADADAAWAQRSKSDAGMAAAQSAADLYAELADAVAPESALEKSELEVRESDALYFIADRTVDEAVKAEIHLAGDQNLEASYKALEAYVATAPADLEEAKMLLAEVIYVKSANMGQWAIATGIGKPEVQARLPEMTVNLARIKELGAGYPRGTGPASVNSYGVLRISGQLELKLKQNLPTALALFKQAYALTGGNADAGVPSNHGTNNLYLAKAAAASGDLELAKKVLRAFVAADATTLNDKRVPETIEEQAEAKDLLASMGG